MMQKLIFFSFLLFIGSKSFAQCFSPDTITCQTIAEELEFILDVPEAIHQGDVINIPLRATGLNSVFGIQFALSYDPSVLNFIDGNDGVFKFGSDVLEQENKLTFLWFTPSGFATDINASDVLISLSFEVIGHPGTSSALLLNDTYEKLIYFQPTNNLFCSICDIELTSTNPFDIICDELFVDYSICTTDEESMEITFRACANDYPVSLSLSGSGINEQGVFNNESDELTFSLSNQNDFTLQAIDAIGVGYNREVEIGTISPVVIRIVESQFPYCYGGLGSVLIEIEGGSPPYLMTDDSNCYAETSSQIFLDNVPAGLNVVSFTDANGCQMESSFEIVEPTQLQAELVIIDATCPEKNDGSIIIIPVGGTPFGNNEYNFGVNGQAQADTIENLYAGSYSRFISDSYGCTLNVTFNIGNINADCGSVNSEFVGIEEFYIQIYPNPVSEVFYINTDALISQDVKIYNLSGQLLIHENYHSGIDISSLTNGIYLVKFQIGKSGKEVVRKISIL